MITLNVTKCKNTQFYGIHIFTHVLVSAMCILKFNAFSISDWSKIKKFFSWFFHLNKFQAFFTKLNDFSMILKHLWISMIFLWAVGAVKTDTSGAYLSFALSHPHINMPNWQHGPAELASIQSSLITLTPYMVLLLFATRFPDYWGHPSLFHTATSLLIWYKMFCVRDKSYRLIWMKFINMFSVYAQSGTHSRFNW